MKIRNAALLAALSLGLAITACEKKDDTPMEEMGNAIGDATNSRDNEEMKDAGEDAKDAMENAADGVKDAVNGENQ